MLYGWKWIESSPVALSTILAKNGSSIFGPNWLDFFSRQALGSKQPASNYCVATCLWHGHIATCNAGQPMCLELKPSSEKETRPRTTSRADELDWYPQLWYRRVIEEWVKENVIKVTMNTWNLFIAIKIIWNLNWKYLHFIFDTSFSIVMH